MVYSSIFQLFYDVWYILKQLEDRGITLDGVFLNAGIFRAAPYADTSQELYNELININLTGSFFVAQSLLPFMKPGGSILFNTSIATQVGLHANAAYAVSKGGLSALVKVMAVELAEKSIRVNALSPGLTLTPIATKTNMPAEAIESYVAEMIKKIPFQRPASANEQAEVAYFLLSPKSSYITGTEIVADGGFINA